MKEIHDNGRWIIMFEENEKEDYERCMNALGKRPVVEEVPYLESCASIKLTIPEIDENAIIRNQGIKGFGLVYSYYQAYKDDLSKERAAQLGNYIISYFNWLKNIDFINTQTEKLVEIIQTFISMDEKLKQKMDTYLNLQKCTMEDILSSRQNLVETCSFLMA